MNGFIIFGYKYSSFVELEHINVSRNLSNCNLVSSDFEEYLNALRSTMLTFGVIFPVFAILIGNFILVTYLCRRQRVFGTQSTSDSQTKIILVLVSCLVLTLSPFVISSLYNYTFLENNSHLTPILKLIKAITINLFLSNFSLTILCFIWSGKAF